MKTIAVVHDLAAHRYPNQFTYKDWLLLQMFSAHAARYADHIIAVSQATADDIARYYGRTENVHVVYHGVDQNVFRPPSKQELAASWTTLLAADPRLRKPYLLYVGQIQPRKNLIRLVEAFEQVHPDLPDLHLVIAGSHGWLKEPIVHRVEKSPIRGNILVAANVTDTLLPSLYWNAQALVLPSLYEGFGLPILEAFACNCPVVTSKVSAMPEVAGEAAEYFDPLDTESIIQGIKRAIARRAELTSRGAQRVRQFTWERTAQQTWEIIQQAAVSNQKQV